ncbi:DUF1642 domain-containing protein [Lactococcus petauri]|uniref:DUF1642 domain-containing protein n=1 Tax=Lactococcus petauri TaxID=1940789 RepID=A0AAJ2IX27_9LACT|nr:DUF1642 domain-containing protein [Lactococcus petauri]MDT2526400.1 DUF1642 domain-containing protein [Lactococcus petauri]MDT2540945.1 DUF1642 domain-containing protein [Lactococcus petauri]MDT2557519.1 DUF1642 domain-containing protein [Lactococcus petauri]MDT2559406.1 DUF1642 domain-containing protein [Lactococcus petauri]MDT2567979.1 DUF1642 domain-containing protein [Lactococcus petauri]
MTKFELPEKPKKTNTSEDFNNLRKAVDELDKFDYAWKTHANKADRRINAANKYIEELERENQRLIAENVAVKTLVDNAKPQQALPVVPECVVEYIERCKRSDCGLIWAIRPDRDANDNSEKVYDWLFPNGVKLPNGMYPNPYEPDNLVRPDKENQIKFVRAWLDGYTVEKPQLFYLKNKIGLEDVGIDLIGYLNLFLTNGGYLTNNINRAKKFTKQEIDSMETGSYELVPVEDGE